MTIGKKKKRVIVYRAGRRAKSPVIPLLILGGVAVWYFVTKDKKTIVETTPVVDNGGYLVDDGTGTGTQTTQPPPIQVLPTVNLPALDTMATGNRTVLLRDAAAYPYIIAAIKKMNSQEIYDTYQYFYGWFVPGKKLYRLPDPSAPGQWNTQLYDAVQTLHTKYGIF